LRHPAAKGGGVAPVACSNNRERKREEGGGEKMPRLREPIVKIRKPARGITISEFRRSWGGKGENQFCGKSGQTSRRS